MAASREELYAISADNQPKRNKIVRRQAGKIRRSEYYKNPYQTNSRPDQRRPAIEKSHLRQWVCFGLAAAIWVAAQRLARPDLNAATPHVGLEPSVETSMSCCVRSQLGHCCVRAKLSAVPQRESRPLMHAAALFGCRVFRSLNKVVVDSTRGIASLPSGQIFSST